MAVPLSRVRHGESAGYVEGQVGQPHAGAGVGAGARVVADLGRGTALRNREDDVAAVKAAAECGGASVIG